MISQFNQDYWTQCYQTNQTGWDAGAITTPIKEYVDQLDDKSIHILIPGAGNGHEAEYLFQNGFKNVSVIDISPEPLKNIQKRVPDFPKEQLIQGDFFEHQGNYDLILEQTFFCALHPSFREDYAKKMHSLLKTNGKLVGVLFNDAFNNDTPPFGGNIEEYTRYFEPYFLIKKMERCYNSIKPREGRELFIHLQKR